MAGRGLVKDVRGLGYLIGIECEVPAKEVQAELRKLGVLVGGSNHAATLGA
jgi:acetylornithine/succinyldiaminopimelate/putrescine aminotransferase